MNIDQEEIKNGLRSCATLKSSRQRYSIIDYKKLIELLGLKNKNELRETYKKWVNNAIESKNLNRESKWTENVAVGSKDFVKNFKSRLAQKRTGKLHKKDPD